MHQTIQTKTMDFSVARTYYKITNEDECHNGFQYKNGLNILKKNLIDMVPVFHMDYILVTVNIF